ncbi:MAG: CapA family protein [Lachnospiraceae bacterium]|nr:CapA family protein [Lachnospiraceae bacterium]
MKKKYIRIPIIISLSLCLIYGCSTDKISNQTPTTTEITTEKITKTPEQIHAEMFPTINDLIKNKVSANAAWTITEDFLDFVEKNLNIDIYPELDSFLNSDTHLENKYPDFWYNVTGLSLNTLMDWYNGTITEEVATYNNGKSTVSLGFAGDLCLSEGWSTLDFYDSHNQDLSQGISNGLIELTNSYDIFMLNNEFTYSTRGEALAGKYYTFRANPERVGIIQELGTDIVSLSNNHVYDFGEEAFVDTLDTLKNAGIPYVGAGRNIDEASAPVYFYINGIKIGYVAANRSEKYIFTPEATNDSSGVLRTYESEKFVKAIREAKDDCDYLVAYVHWGTEDSNVVADYQFEMGEEFFEAGADAVIGGHPHVLQGVDYYDDSPIAYSLGDFWFNDLHDDTGILCLNINFKGTSKMSFVPCRREDGITSLVTDKEESRRIYDYMEDISFGIKIDDDGVIRKEGVKTDNNEDEEFFLPSDIEIKEYSADTPYQTAYADIVAEFERLFPNDDYTYNLIYFDGDDVPELVAALPCFINMYTYDSGKIYTIIDDWGYGAMGNVGYEYAPYKNTLRNYNADLAGAIVYETYMKINENNEIDYHYEESLTRWLFDDKDDSGYPSDDEFVDETLYYYGNKKITEEEYNSYVIDGEYEYIEGKMNVDEIMAELGR